MVQVQVACHRLKILTHVEKSCSWYGISDPLVCRTPEVCMSKWWTDSLCVTWQEANEAPAKSWRCWCIPVDMWQRERACFANVEAENVLNRDPHEGRVGVSEATVDERTGNVLGTVQCEVGTDVAECTDVIETGFWKCLDVCIKWDSTVKGNAKNPDLIENLDKVSGDIDSRGNWKRTWVLGSAKHKCHRFVWVQS